VIFVFLPKAVLRRSSRKSTTLILRRQEIPTGRGIHTKSALFWVICQAMQGGKQYG